MHKVAFPHCYLLYIGNCGSRFSNWTTSIFLTRLLYVDLATLCKSTHSQLFTFQPLLFSFGCFRALCYMVANSQFSQAKRIDFFSKSQLLSSKNSWNRHILKLKRGCVISLWRTPFYFLPFHRYEIFKKHFYLQQSPNFHKLGLCLSAKDLYFCRKLL